MNKNSLVTGMALFVALSGASTANAGAFSGASVVEWLAAYGKAWETRDADAAAALFAENATYQENPYEEPFNGRTGVHDYWSRVTADQRDVSFTSDVITTFGRSAVAHWSAQFASASSGATVNLDGVFLLEFDESGLCSTLREWWIVKVDTGNSPSAVE
ncbi:MAG: nuclear transport factor 2 family protein [Woeseiaceae bacterium]